MMVDYLVSLRCCCNHTPIVSKLIFVVKLPYVVLCTCLYTKVQPSQWHTPSSWRMAYKKRSFSVLIQAHLPSILDESCPVDRISKQLYCIICGCRHLTNLTCGLGSGISSRTPLTSRSFSTHPLL